MSIDGFERLHCWSVRSFDAVRCKADSLITNRRKVKMLITRLFRSTRAGAVTLAIGIGAAAQPALAADFTVDLPQGQACPRFDLRIEITSNPNRVIKEFQDKAGTPVRILNAGKGDSLTLTNLNSGSSLSLRPNGAVANTKINADGSQLVTSMGHNVLIMFPTDVPAGPSTTLYVGRFVYTVNLNGVFTLQTQATSGKSSDICAALSG